MTSRADIDRLLTEVYAARKGNDPEAVWSYFATDGVFAQFGPADQRLDAVQSRSNLDDLFKTFTLVEATEYNRVIDPPRAAIHWRGTFRANATGNTGTTDLLDIATFTDGKITSFTTFYDQAIAARLLAAGS